MLQVSLVSIITIALLATQPAFAKGGGEGGNGGGNGGGSGQDNDNGGGGKGGGNGNGNSGGDSGRANTALRPLTPSDGGIVAATGTNGADRRLAAVIVAGDLTAVDAAWEFAAAVAARELAVPAVAGATDVDA